MQQREPPTHIHALAHVLCSRRHAQGYTPEYTDSTSKTCVLPSASHSYMGKQLQHKKASQRPAMRQL